MESNKYSKEPTCVKGVGKHHFLFKSQKFEDNGIIYLISIKIKEYMRLQKMCVCHVEKITKDTGKSNLIISVILVVVGKSAEIFN